MYGWYRRYSSSMRSSPVPIQSRPPHDIASRAFRTRFMTTCSICPPSARTLGRPFREGRPDLDMGADDPGEQLS